MLNEQSIRIQETLKQLFDHSRNNSSKVIQCFSKSIFRPNRQNTKHQLESKYDGKVVLISLKKNCEFRNK